MYEYKQGAEQRNVSAVTATHSVMSGRHLLAFPALRSGTEKCVCGDGHPYSNVRATSAGVPSILTSYCEVWAKRPSLTLKLGTNGLKVTSEPKAGQAGCPSKIQ
ncbi:hypothetical protein J6590_105541, partial [Homalodisca vitripennis]